MATRKAKSTASNLSKLGAWASIIGIPLALLLWYVGTFIFSDDTPERTLSSKGENSPVIEAGRDAIIGDSLPRHDNRTNSDGQREASLDTTTRDKSPSIEMSSEGDNSPVLNAGRDAVVNITPKAEETFAERFSDAENLSLALKYYKGDGVKMNYSLARQHAQAAMDQGNAEAVYLAATWYERGDVFTEDHKEAERLFQESFRMGNPEGAYRLGQKSHAIVRSMRGPSGGLMYAAHYGLQEPLHWFIQAHRAGHPEALKTIKEYKWSDVTLGQLKEKFPASYEYLKEHLVDEITVVEVVPVGNGL